MARTLRLMSAVLLLGSSELALAQSGDWTVSEASGSVTVAANSRVRIPAAAQKQGMFEVIQEWGNAIFQIEKQAKPHFGVQTPYLAAVVKGTTFSITVTQEGASLQVVEGAVETSTLDGGAKDLIRPGIVASVHSGDVYRLTVQGQNTRQIDSPQRGTGAAGAAALSIAAPAPTGAQAVDIVDAAVTSADTGNLSPNFEFGRDKHGSETRFVTQAVGSAPVDLGKATSGLVAGNSAVQIGSIDAALIRSGNSNVSGNGNGNGNAGANSNAGGNGNGNGND